MARLCVLCLAWLGCVTRVHADDGHCNALLDLAARRQVRATRHEGHVALPTGEAAA